MRKTTKRTRTTYHIEWQAPVAYKTLACQQSEVSSLPQTVYHVTEPDGCAWFHASISWWGDDNTTKHPDWVIQPLVTYLPSRYFVR